MLVLMRPDATPADVDGVIARITELGFQAHPIPGAQRTAIGITGNPGALDPTAFADCPGVAEAVPVSKPFKLVSREMKPDATVIEVPVAGGGRARLGGGTFAVIAGPCAVEGREQILAAARAVAAAGATFLRGGAYKPRTSPYAFQGLKEEGLALLEEARAATGLPVVTELVDTAQLERVARSADVVQIGARNMQNFALLEAVGGLRQPVMLKRGLSATIQELLMAAEYIVKQGNYQVILCERGIRTFETMTRNTLDIGAIPLLKRLSHLPVIVDPSHATGDVRLVAPCARAALAVGADGIMVEVHPAPRQALSDGPQSLDFAAFGELMSALRAIAPAVGLTL
jgi:3-deoxy-7-phosphoheptulonate synthase